MYTEAENKKFFVKVVNLFKKNKKLKPSTKYVLWVNMVQGPIESEYPPTTWRPKFYTNRQELITETIITIKLMYHCRPYEITKTGLRRVSKKELDKEFKTQRVVEAESALRIAKAS